jgi:hypothetical protein
MAVLRDTSVRRFAIAPTGKESTIEAPAASTCLRERRVAITMGLHARRMAPRMQRWMWLAACELISCQTQSLCCKA